MSILPPYLFLLLFTEAPLPRQARALGQALRVRLLQPDVPHEELTHDAQKSSASGLQQHAQAAAQDLGHEERPRHHPALAAPVTRA